MSDLPPLPEHHTPIALLHLSKGAMAAVHAYAESYARAAVAAERARCAELCEAEAAELEHDDMAQGYGMRLAAAAIRNAA